MPHPFRVFLRNGLETCKFSVYAIPSPSSANFRFEIGVEMRWIRERGLRTGWILSFEAEKLAVKQGDINDIPDTVFCNLAYAERDCVIDALRRGLL